MTDPIADMLTRIRNAQAIGKPEVLVPMSKLKLAIAKILEQQHWVEKVSVLETQPGTKKEFSISLKYVDGKPAISSLKRISKPSLRIYVGKDELPRVLNNFGLAIISTNRGMMTNKEAGKQGLGGEIICEIY